VSSNISSTFTSRAIHESALGVLREWPGFGPLQDVMQALPSMSIYLAGGALRNIILGGDNKCKDFDIFINVEHLQNAVIRLGLHGSVQYGPFNSPRWHPIGAGEVYCDLIPIERFYTGLWRCEDIVDVLNQFDFTANAVALDLRSADLFDPVHGLRDIHRRAIRAVRFDYPDAPFMPGQKLSRLQVLWLRLIHYAAKLNFTIEPLTLRWLREHQRYADGAEQFSEIFFPLHHDAIGILDSVEQ